MSYSTQPESEQHTKSKKFGTITSSKASASAIRKSLKITKVHTATATAALSAAKTGSYKTTAAGATKKIGTKSGAKAIGRESTALKRGAHATGAKPGAKGAATEAGAKGNGPRAGTKGVGRKGSLVKSG